MSSERQLYDNTKAFKILSIDGGGIRGLYPAKFLSELEYQLELDGKPSELHKYFDLICGTSTGGIIAIGLALGMKASEIASLYADNAADIFGNGKGFFKSFFNPKHRKKNLKSLLRKEFNRQVEAEFARLGHAKTRLCIPTFNAFYGRLSVLKTCHHQELKRDYHYPAVDVALATSAAPTFFPPHSFTYNKIGQDDPSQISNYIDGGIVANNPSLIGVLEASQTLSVPLENIKLLSIGTGEASFTETKKNMGWGLLYWINPKRKRLMELIFSSQTDNTTNILKFLNMGVGNNGSNHFINERLQFTFDDIKPIKLDEYRKEKLDWLQEQADNDFQIHGTRIINQFCNDTTTPYEPFYEL